MDRASTTYEPCCPRTPHGVISAGRAQHLRPSASSVDIGPLHLELAIPHGVGFSTTARWWTPRPWPWSFVRERFPAPSVARSSRGLFSRSTANYLGCPGRHPGLQVGENSSGWAAREAAQARPKGFPAPFDLRTFHHTPPWKPSAPLPGPPSEQNWSAFAQRDVRKGPLTDVPRHRGPCLNIDRQENRSL